MPAIPNYITLAYSATFKDAIKCEMIRFASAVLSTETPIISPNLGYKMYGKRMDFAARVIENVDLYATACAKLVAMCQPDVELNNYNGGEPARWMKDNNGTGQSVMTFRPEYFSLNPVGSTSGQQIWDNLAGVNQEDLL